MRPALACLLAGDDSLLVPVERQHVGADGFAQAVDVRGVSTLDHHVGGLRGGMLTRLFGGQAGKD
ncbi:hypothetical protein [Pandoraea sp. NPDC087047]|uniref:hypothetical protein n=1 Tax=Pandoraea sp. NPDC087047 TaxID=3364390 RepID=UPI00380119BD